MWPIKTFIVPLEGSLVYNGDSTRFTGDFLECPDLFNTMPLKFGNEFSAKVTQFSIIILIDDIIIRKYNFGDDKIYCYFEDREILQVYENTSYEANQLARLLMEKHERILDEEWRIS